MCLLSRYQHSNNKYKKQTDLPSRPSSGCILDILFFIEINRITAASMFPDRVTIERGNYG